MNLLQTLALLASITLPFFNIPLIVRIFKRKSSEDVSLLWALGIFTCLWLMIPAALSSPDFIFKIFAILNALFFSGVTAVVLYFRWK